MESTITEGSRKSRNNKSKIRRRRIRRRRRILMLTLLLLATFVVAFGKRMTTTYAKLLRAPEELQKLYERNPDARKYVLDFEKESGKEHEIDLSEYANTENVPLLMQWDERWGYNQYAGDYFGLSGCGPTCMSMAYIYLTKDTDKSPAYMGKYSEDNGYACAGSGTYWSFITEGGRALGLDVTEIPLDKNRIDENLEAGNPIICIMGPGDFTSGGHFIVLSCMYNGEYRINDPNSYRNSKKTWTYGEISGQIRDLWVIRKG